MIIYEVKGRYVHIYSDRDVKIKQKETGNIYDDVMDLNPSRYEYEETDIPIEDEDLTDDEIGKALGDIL